MVDKTDWDDDVFGEDETDETIIELTDVADHGLDHAIGEDDIIELEDKVIELTDVVEPESVDLDQQLLETTLEKVIEKKFSSKIENILFEVMEKVIEKEIAQIKDSLQKDLNQIGNA